MEYNGQGTLFIESEGELHKLPVAFYLIQRSDSKIIGKMILLEKNMLELSGLFNKTGLISHLEGRTESRLIIKIKDIAFSKTHFRIRKNGFPFSKLETHPDLEFFALKVEVFGTLSNVDQIKFGLINFELFNKFSISFLDKELKFVAVENFKELKEIIQIDNQPQLTAIAELVVEKSDPFKLDILYPIHYELSKLFEITSLAQGITHGFCYSEAYLKEKIVYGQYRWIKTRKQGFYPIIWIVDFSKFISHCYSQYSDEFRDTNALQLSIELYLESLSAINAETKIILYFTALEHLLYNYKTLINKNEIIEQSVFQDIRDDIQKGISKTLKSVDIPSEERGRVYQKIPELNRHSLETILDDYLKELKIGYKDLFEKFTEIKSIRDQIIHSGKADCDPELLFQTKMKGEALLHRIFLSIFNYEGEQWINCFNGFKHEKFKRRYD